ncbi:MAG: acyltransferase [Pseudomonadota bacterium]
MTSAGSTPHTEPATEALASPVQRFTILESWRAILAWWVVLSHAIAMLRLKPEHITEMRDSVTLMGFDLLAWLQILGYDILFLARSGKIPVYVFMMMSGFVIMHLLTLKKEPYGIYLMRRFLRLWPALMFVLVLYAAAYVVGRPLGYSTDFWGHFALEATMFHGLVPDEIFKKASSAISGPGWSISLEWQFYIVAPFILTAFVKGGWRGWLLFVCLYAAYFFGMVGTRSASVFGETYTWEHPSALPHIFGFFALGMGTYFLFKKVREAEVQPSMPLIGLLAACYATIGFVGPEELTPPILIWLAVFVTLITSGTWLHSLLNWPVLRWLGDISYSTYITHMLAIPVAHRIAQKLGFADGSLQIFLVMMVFAIPMILTLSVISFYFIEKPAIQFGRTQAKRLMTKPLMETS